MIPKTDIETRRLAATVGIGLMLLVGGVGMLGWLRQGPDMFLALAQSGLSMCF